MESDTQQSRLINFGGDHPRLTFEGKQLLGSAVLLILVAVVIVGFWKQIQAQRRRERRPERRRDTPIERVDLMASVKRREDQESGGDGAGRAE